MDSNSTLTTPNTFAEIQEMGAITFEQVTLYLIPQN